MRFQFVLLFHSARCVWSKKTRARAALPPSCRLCEFYLPHCHLGVSFLLFFVMQRQWWLELNFKVHRISNESFASGSPSHACDGRKTQELAALSLIKKAQAAARCWKIASALRCGGDAGALPFIKLYYAGNRKFLVIMASRLVMKGEQRCRIMKNNIWKEGEGNF